MSVPTPEDDLDNAASAASLKYRVLYPVDPLAEPQQLVLNIDWIEPGTSKLLLLMVCEVPDESLAWFRKSLMGSPQLRRQVAAREAELQEQMFAAAKVFEHQGYEVDTRVKRGKHLGQVILSTAEEFQVDCLVMRRRCQPPWQRWLVGSVVDYVSKRCQAPMLILPPLKKDDGSAANSG